MKKIISLILVLMMALMPAGIVSAADTDILDTVVEKLASYSPETRASYISYFRPFITSDAGVNAAIINLDSGLMDSMLTDILGNDLDKDGIKRVFYSFRCIKEDTNIRLDYADVFQNKVELSGASNSVISGMNKLVKAYTDNSDAAKKIFEEDGITAGVIANMFTAIPKINDGKIMFSYENGEFLVKDLDATFKTDFDSVWSGYKNKDGKTINLYKVAEGLTKFLNQKVSDSDKSSVAQALSELNVCSIVSSGTSSNGGAVGSDKNQDIKPVQTETDNYVVLENAEGISSDMLNGGFVIKTKDNTDGVIEISAEGTSPVIFEVNNGNKVPVKYSYSNGNSIIAQVKPNTVYIVHEGEYPFADATGWGKDYISALYNRGIISGKSKTEFEPDASITREEFVKLVVELFGLNNTSSVVDFDDVDKDAWYYSYVASAYENKLINGVGDNLFGVGQKIKRQDMAKIIGTVLEMKGIKAEKASENTFADFDRIDDYAKDYVLAISGLGIISGDDNKNFNPDKFATRQEAAKMVYGMLTAYVDSLKE